MENQIIVKGRVCNLKPSEGDKPQEFGLTLSTGKIKSTGEWAKGIIYNVTDWNNSTLENKQTIIVEGYFKSYLGKDGTEKHQLNAKRVQIVDGKASTQQAPQSVQNMYSDLPF
jgi:hypothetical protein